MRQYVEVVLHICQSLCNLTYFVHLRKLHLILRHLFNHEAKVFFVGVKVCEANREVEAILEVRLVITICLALIFVNANHSVF